MSGEEPGVEVPGLGLFLCLGLLEVGVGFLDSIEGEVKNYMVRRKVITLRAVNK